MSLVPITQLTSIPKADEFLYGLNTKFKLRVVVPVLDEVSPYGIQTVNGAFAVVHLYKLPLKLKDGRPGFERPYLFLIHLHLFPSI
jgi:hypothetical protein